MGSSGKRLCDLDYADDINALLDSSIEKNANVDTDRGRPRKTKEEQLDYV